MIERGEGHLAVEKSRLAQREVLKRWVANLEQVHVSEHRAPVINKERLLDLMEQAKATHTELVFVAIGCQDWVKPEWGDPAVDRLMGRITGENKRAQKFVAELASFSQSLTTLQVPHRIHFSLSDTEAVLHLRLKNMGQIIHNDDAEAVMQKNVHSLGQKLGEKGAHVIPFIHSQLLQELFGVETPEELQQKIGGEEGQFRQFLDNLYAFDLQHTAQHFVAEKGLGPVWLDIQSFNYVDDVLSFEQAAKTVAPEMPILSIFPNAGNWHAGQDPTVSFPTKEDVVAQLVGSKNTPQNSTEWLNKLHKTRDERLSEVLQSFGQEARVIQSSEEKTLAVRLFFQLVFGFDPTAEKGNQ